MCTIHLVAASQSVKPIKLNRVFGTPDILTTGTEIKWPMHGKDGHGILKFPCSLNDLKKKNSLMASFRMLLNKKKKSIKSGMARDELVKLTWLAFETMETFLAPVYHCAPSIDTEVNTQFRGVKASFYSLEGTVWGHYRVSESSVSTAKDDQQITSVPFESLLNVIAG
ncbi:hypothetical protein NQ318_011618 [Aromia moschata]|uniref:Uncharacterized protein n=1 Tax=Aromia moschata TaxID=1265417 RepID=A0AAV8Z6K7_9CUCU|nr:hypothetical protein NQ318_011618 [Aromia moschata]